MSEWSIVKLKDIVTGLYDGPHATPPESNNGAIFLGIKNVTEDGRLDLSDIRHISLDDYPRWIKRVKPQGGDIVFSYEATLHRYAIIPKDFFGCLGRRMALIRVNEAIADRRFIFQYLLSNNWRREVEKNILSGATVDRIPLTNVPDFELCIPPLPTQQKIASILSAYDDLIENNLKRIKLLEEIAQRTYEEWFVKFRINGKELAIDEGTRLPEGWERKKIGQFYKLGSGGTPSRKKQELYFDNGSVPWIRTQELKDCIIVEPEEKITEIGLKESSAKLFPAHTVLLAMYGNTIGKTAYLGIAASTNQACCAFLDERVYRSYYMHQYLLANKQEILRYRMGAAQENISQEIIKSIEITAPEETTLIQFGEIIEPQYKLITDLNKQNILLKEARDILLPRLMSGEMDVNEMEMKEIESSIL